MIENSVVSNKRDIKELAKYLESASLASKVLGHSKDGFGEFKKMYATGGEEAIKELVSKKSGRKKQIDPDIEEAVFKMAFDNPLLGPNKVSKELKAKGITISSGGVRNIWLKHEVETTLKKVKLLESKVAEENLVLTEYQKRAIDKFKVEDIESAYPGYLGVQDTFLLESLEGIGDIYQQIFIDTYSYVSIVKLYDQKSPLVAADLLNDKVLPFYEDHGIQLRSVQTDSGYQYCGNVQRNAFELYLAMENITHIKQGSKMCEQLYKKIKNEFFNKALKDKSYKTIEELQADMDLWLADYNEKMVHAGQRCNGRTPMQTFVDGLPLAKPELPDEPAPTVS